MLTIVITCNILIALICFFVAWQIWKLRRSLASVTRTLVAAERNTHKVLHGAPNAITKGQMLTYQLSEQLKQLEPQTQRLRQIAALLGVGSSLLRRGSRRIKPLASRRPIRASQRKN